MVQKKATFNNTFDKKVYEQFLKLAGLSNVINPINVMLNLNCGILEDEFQITKIQQAILDLLAQEPRLTAFGPSEKLG